MSLENPIVSGVVEAKSYNAITWSITPAGNVVGAAPEPEEIFSVDFASDDSTLFCGIFAVIVLSEDVDSLSEFLGFGVEVFS